MILIIVAILIIGCIIAFHEFGHFLAAKLFHIGVVEFALGMGPVLFWRRIGETVYSLRAIPIGGFCAMYGEQAVESTVQNPVSRKSPDFKQDWDVSRSYSRHPKWQQVVIALAGPGFNLLLAFLAAFVLVCLPDTAVGRPEITALGPVAVAESAGVQVGDIVLSVDGRDMFTANEYATYLETHPDKTKTGYSLTVYRPSDDTTYSFSLVPDVDTGLVGLTYQAQVLTGPFRYFDGACRLVRHNIMMSVDSLGMLFRGDAGIQDMTGIIGMSVAVGDTVQEASEIQAAGIEDGSNFAILQAIMTMTMMISIAVGFMNLLPLPALDGGRAVIAIFECLFKKSLPDRAALYINGICMLLLMCLMAAVMVMDLIRIVQ